MGSPLRSLVKLSLYLAWTGTMLPLQALFVALSLPLARRFPMIYHRVCCRIMGLKLVVRGRRARSAGPVLFVCNHSSYIDISVLGSQLLGSFVAKAEVADWPFFGTLAKLQRTVFVDRRIRSTATQRDRIRERLRKGENLILFPEGTSDDGNRVLPFRSALFSVAEAADGEVAVTVQPVSLAYAALDGMPMGRNLRPYFAWYGDMDLLGHMWLMLGICTATAVLTYGEPVRIDAFGSRKALSRYCEAEVARGLASALSGGWREPRRPAAAPQVADAGTPA